MTRKVTVSCRMKVKLRRFNVSLIQSLSFVKSVRPLPPYEIAIDESDKTDWPVKLLMES